jgi:hypothetical protein
LVIGGSLQEILDFESASEFEILARGYLKHQGIEGFDFLNLRRFFLKHSSDAISGNRNSIVIVATLLATHGQRDNAELLLSALADKSNNDAKALLGALLLEKNELTQAHSIIWECAKHNALGIYSLGLLYRKVKQEGADEFAAYGLSYVNGFKLGLFATARLSFENGEDSAAETMFELSAGDGFTESFGFLARMASEKGDSNLEKEFLSKGAALGDANCAYGLACLLLEAGQSEQAEAFFRDAAVCGHVAGAGELSLLLRKKIEALFVKNTTLFGQSLEDPLDEDLRREILSLERVEMEWRLEFQYWVEFAAKNGYSRVYQDYYMLLESNGKKREADIWREKASKAWEELYMNEVFGD